MMPTNKKHSIKGTPLCHLEEWCVFCVFVLFVCLFIVVVVVFWGGLFLPLFLFLFFVFTKSACFLILPDFWIKMSKPEKI